MKNNTMSAFMKLFTTDIPVKTKCLECTQLDVSCSGIPTTSSTEACPEMGGGGINIDSSRGYLDGKLLIIKGDITKCHTDAIVNAANKSLLGGGGVDGAIHRAAGPGLLEECKRYNGCSTGSGVMTGGHNLPAKYVIHTVGPIWNGGEDNEDSLLASCYRFCLSLADINGVKTIAFPSISTGAYGFPVERAAKIAVEEIAEYMEGYKEALKYGARNLERVIMVCFDNHTRDVYVKATLEYTSSLEV